MDYSEIFAASAPELPAESGRIQQPLDASVLDPQKIEAWLERFRWPVSDRSFDGFAREVLDRYADAVREAEDQVSILLRADFAFCGFLIQHLHLASAHASFEAAGEQPIVGSITVGFLRPDWEKLAREHDTCATRFQRLRLLVRSVAKSWLLNRHLPLVCRFAALSPFSKTRVLGSCTRLTAEHVEGTKAAANHTYAEINIPRRKHVPQARPALERSVATLVNSIDQAANDHLGIRLDVDAAAACWHSRLARLDGVAAAIRECASAPERLYLSNTGLTLHRLLALVWRRRGTEVVGVHHGNDLGTHPNFVWGPAELSLADTYIVPTETSARWHRWVSDGGPQISSPTFVSAGTSFYGELHRRLTRAPFPDGKTKILIVAFALSWIRFPCYVGHYALLQLDLELRLAEFLRANGYEVILKVHPEWQALSETLWRDRVDAVPNSVFESCWVDADVLLFPRVTSTTFGYALCTNRPVVVLDSPEQSWNPEARELISRRCRFVACNADDANRLRFDGKDLLAAIERSENETDHGYLHQAMMPSQSGRAA